ncbi:hypothetical protein AB1Y20_018235 [Prymnesium parvum]|uniref:Uncharacterized protein n=1 Tax=Prymnesium parvum TaxID=97485 RepID=A0AB34JRD9_PRYPA
MKSFSSRHTLLIDVIAFDHDCCALSTSSFVISLPGVGATTPSTMTSSSEAVTVAPADLNRSSMTSTFFASSSPHALSSLVDTVGLVVTPLVGATLPTIPEGITVTVAGCFFFSRPRSIEASEARAAVAGDEMMWARGATLKPSDAAVRRDSMALRNLQELKPWLNWAQPLRLPRAANSLVENVCVP